MIAAQRAGSCWYRSENQGRINMQIAAQRWIAELVETGRITRGQKMLLEEIAKFVDAKRTTQKSIAFLAKRCGVRDRTIQRYLRGLCPSKAKNPEAWQARVVTRRFIHAAPEPGRKADNVPSWFTLEIPERFFAPKTPAGMTRKRREIPPPKPVTRRSATAVPDRSPGGVEIVTQAVILGSVTTEITETLHPCTNLGPPPAPSGSAAPNPPAPLPPTPERVVPPPPPPPVGGALAVSVCAKLFPSHAPLAHRAVLRLAALGWSEAEIVTYLRKASKDPGLAPGNARHPLLTAVWLAERDYRQPPRPPNRRSAPRAPENPEPTTATATDPPTRAIDPTLLGRIARAKEALALAERRTGVTRPRSVQDLPPSPMSTGPRREPDGDLSSRGPKKPEKN